MFLKKMIWLIPLVSEHFVHCRRAGVDNSHYHNIASDLVVSVVKDLEQSEHFLKEPVDSIFILGMPPFVFKDRRTRRVRTFPVIPEDTWHDRRIQLLDIDLRFRQDSLLGKVNILKYYFIQFDTVFVDAGQLTSGVIFGSLSSRVKSVYVFTPEAREVSRKEFVSATVE